MVLLRAVVALAPFAPLALACGSGMPHPTYVQQKTAALQQVGYPAPPARVEFIPARPPGNPVWLDGEWGWSGSKWAWSQGRWVMAPVGATYSPWTTVRDERGSVYFASGVWNDAGGRPLPPPAPLALGRAMPGDVTSPEGDNEKTGAAPPAPSSSAASAPSGSSRAPSAPPAPALSGSASASPDTAGASSAPPSPSSSPAPSASPSSSPEPAHS